MSFPDYDSLPPVKGMPAGCAWGVFDKDGKKDVYGCLNKITPDIVKAATQEVKDGLSVSLNWPIGGIKKPGFFRKGLVHNVMSFLDGPMGIHGFDDEVEFNTQCSSQWDSLCHFFHQPSARGYNDANPSVKDLTQDYGNEDKTKSLPTLNREFLLSFPRILPDPWKQQGANTAFCRLARKGRSRGPRRPDRLQSLRG